MISSGEKYNRARFKARFFSYRSPVMDLQNRAFRRWAGVFFQPSTDLLTNALLSDGGGWSESPT